MFVLDWIRLKLRSSGTLQRMMRERGWHFAERVCVAASGNESVLYRGSQRSTVYRRG